MPLVTTATALDAGTEPFAPECTLPVGFASSKSVDARAPETLTLGKIAVQSMVRPGRGGRSDLHEPVLGAAKSDWIGLGSRPTLTKPRPLKRRGSSWGGSLKSLGSGVGSRMGSMKDLAIDLAATKASQAVIKVEDLVGGAVAKVGESLGIASREVRALPKTSAITTARAPPH